MCVVLVLVGSPCLADYEAEVTADNPTSWWRFEDPSSAHGSTAADSAGVFPGVYTGDIQLLAGIVGQSARFDGFLDYVAIGQMGATPIQGSIELWFLAEAVQNYRNVFTTGPLGGLANGNNAIRFEEHATGDFYLAISDDSGGLPDFVVSLTPNLVVDTWYHVVVTWDTSSGVVNVYLDGARVIVDSVNTFWPAQFSDVKIGIGYDALGERSWLGRADEVAVYEHELSHWRIGAHFWEVTGTFADGFESGDTSAWSSTVP
jgi:hypothetical protein